MKKRKATKKHSKRRRNRMKALGLKCMWETEGHQQFRGASGIDYSDRDRYVTPDKSKKGKGDDPK